MRLARLFGTDLHAGDFGGLEIRGISCDSRKTTAGHLFFALRGSASDGHEYAEAAVARGAVAVVAERPLCGLAVPCWVFAGARALLARAAARWHQLEDAALQLVGITGTNGKTTTGFLLRGILGEAQTALLGTCGYWIGRLEHEASMTTPDPLTLAELLSLARDAGQTRCVMEVSSHALDQGRTAGLEFEVAVFTNLSRDHLDYHKTPEAYFAAKARLFEQLAPSATAVLNLDDPRGRELQERTAAQLLGYARRPDAGAALWATAPHYQLDSTRFQLCFASGERLDVRLPMPGEHNVENALAAAGAALALGIEPAAIARALSRPLPVPGRCELVPALPGVATVVDYAHTDHGLQRVLISLRSGLRGRLIVVFGAGGERDRGKRERMGRVADALADVSIVTSDNPRSEAPAAIARAICAGFRQRPRICLDRRAAIREALFEARPGDCVLIAGKGHETTQTIGARRLPFSDRQVLLEEAARLQSCQHPIRLPRSLTTSRKVHS